MEWFLKALRQYADFSGRARRKEYWMFTLFYLIIYIVLIGIDSLINVTGVLSILFALGMLVPSLSVTVRRLHDIGKSGWFFLLLLIPIVGPIAMLVFTCQDSQPGTNEYGPNPKDVVGNSSGALDSNI
jgi:uncharacterized membrane protein YhaH (DUF805 family)